MVNYLPNTKGLPQHSYEEIRRAALDILAKRETAPYPPDQFAHLEIGVAQVLAQRDGVPDRFSGGQTPRLSDEDQALFQEMFWDLFRQGVITLGRDR